MKKIILFVFLFTFLNSQLLKSQNIQVLMESGKPYFANEQGASINPENLVDLQELFLMFNQLTHCPNQSDNSSSCKHCICRVINLPCCLSQLDNSVICKNWTCLSIKSQHCLNQLVNSVTCKN